MAKQIMLREYEFLQYRESSKPNFINQKTFEKLEQFVLENETSHYLKITTKKGFGKVLQAQNYVGAMQTKDKTTIEILPKLKTFSDDRAKKLLLEMLKTLKKSPFKNFNKAELNSLKTPLFEIFITMFLDELSHLIRKGIKSSYIAKK